MVWPAAAWCWVTQSDLQQLFTLIRYAVCSEKHSRFVRQGRRCTAVLSVIGTLANIAASNNSSRSKNCQRTIFRLVLFSARVYDSTTGIAHPGGKEVGHEHVQSNLFSYSLTAAMCATLQTVRHV